MSKSSLAEDLVKFVLSDPRVSGCKKGPPVPGNGKKKVKIEKGADEICFSVTEPDHPKFRIHVLTKDVEPVKRSVMDFLSKQAGVRISFV